MNEYYCVMPFFGLELQPGVTTPCCLLPNDANISQVQQTMLDGKRPQECRKCWDLEDRGFESDRMIKNKSFDYYTDKDIEFLEQECKDKKFSPQILKIYTSTLCNSTCVTCNPKFSTAWASLKGIPIVNQTINNSRLDTINWEEVKMLSLLGGEPLYEKKNLEILEKLYQVGNHDCFIDVTTNASVKLSDKHLSMLSKFKKVNFCLSIDGIGKEFEYIRYPLKWDAVESNIAEYRKAGISLSISFTISNLNILSYDKITHWFKSNGLPYNYNLVTHPRLFSVNSLPEQVKQGLPFVRSHQSEDSGYFDMFVNELESQDKLKGINVKDYLPELSKVIDNFRKY